MADMENKVENQEEEGILVLTDEEGRDERFELLDVVEHQGETYVVLMPVDAEDGLVVILQVQEIPGSDEDDYLTVEDDAVSQAVYDLFRERNKDVFTFDGEL